MEAKLRLEILFKKVNARLSTVVDIGFMEHFHLICNSWMSPDSKSKDFYEDECVRMWLIAYPTGKEYEEKALAREAELLKK